MPPHAVQESRSILVIVVVQLDLWIDHFPNHSLNRKCDCCSYHPPLIYCFLDLLRSYYFASKLLIARAICLHECAENFQVSSSAKPMAGRCRSLLWGFSTTSRADDMAVGGGYLHLQAFHEKYDEVNGRDAQRYNFPAKKRGENGGKSIPASLFQLLLQLQSTASLLQWPCMMLRRWVLSKLLLVIIFHCH